MYAIRSYYVFFHDSLQRTHDLVFVAFALGRQGEGNDRFERRRAGENNRFGAVAQGVAGFRFFQFGHRDDVPGRRFGHWMLFFASYNFV